MIYDTHLRAIESQIALAFTLCAIAETEIRYSSLDEAISVTNNVRDHAATISSHVDKPNHLPSTAVPVLRKQLTELNKRSEEIEAKIRKRQLVKNPDYTH